MYLEEKYPDWRFPAARHSVRPRPLMAGELRVGNIAQTIGGASLAALDLDASPRDSLINKLATRKSAVALPTLVFPHLELPPHLTGCGTGSGPGGWASSSRFHLSPVPSH